MPLRKPPWLRRRIPPAGLAGDVARALGDLSLHTVCQEAHCPNLGECYGRGTATFLLLGPACTRNCSFCAVSHRPVSPPRPDEPEDTAEAARRLKLDFCVLTMVTRDDLADGGAGHVARTIRAVRAKCPGVGLEVLVSDLGGDAAALETVLAARPEVLNHNVETVPRLYPRVRPQAAYRRSLDLLARADEYRPRPVTKSGLMLGLGETREEVLAVMDDLRAAGCDALTLGQYLAPSEDHHPVVRFLPPEEFEDLAREAETRGFTACAAGPYVRSSYQAAQVYQKAAVRAGR
ncbi:MAG: lipoyl synthase [Thermodesulfobacteriota bacterium]